MIDNIQQTAFLIFLISIAFCIVWKKGEYPRYSVLLVWGIAFFGSVSTVLITTLIRIWS